MGVPDAFGDSVGVGGEDGRRHRRGVNLGRCRRAAGRLRHGGMKGRGGARRRRWHGAGSRRRGRYPRRRDGSGRGRGRAWRWDGRHGGEPDHLSKHVRRRLTPSLFASAARTCCLRRARQRPPPGRRCGRAHRRSRHPPAASAPPRHGSARSSGGPRPAAATRCYVPLHVTAAAPGGPWSGRRHPHDDLRRWPDVPEGVTQARCKDGIPRRKERGGRHEIAKLDRGITDELGVARCVGEGARRRGANCWKRQAKSLRAAVTVAFPA